MGPIEKELREFRGGAAWCVASEEMFDVCIGAARNMGLQREFLQTMAVDADVLSEAIEAAEALGL